ncbi:MAG: mucoidy inhibitor MuiA family protein [Nitrospirota bacterium]|nr:mucoidy inhibitor MuiA family protein [Nitrospirota bacterium]
MGAMGGVVRVVLAAVAIIGVAGVAGAVGVDAAWAGEVAASARITAATVFANGAEVTRNARVQLPAGSSTVVFADLPPLPEDTLQVSGEGEQAVRIVSVETRRRYLAEVAEARERELRQQIEVQEDRQRAINDRIGAQRARLDFIRSVTSSQPQAAQTAREGLLRDDPAKWRGAWDAVGEGTAAALTAIQKEEQERRVSDRELNRLRQELARVATGSRLVMDVRVQVVAERATLLRLALRHAVAAASWQPLYDLRLDAEAGKIAIVQQAQVRQQSGEDWNGVTLTLSTTRPAQGVAMPEPQPWLVDFVGPQIALSPNAKGAVLDRWRELPADVGGNLLSVMDADESAPAPAPVAAERVVAEARVAEFTAAYAIDGRQDIPADNESHLFTVAEHAAQVTLLVRTWPAAQPAAYLYAQLTYAGDAPLPGGSATVFRDGVMVGKGSLPQVRPGEEIKLPFGIDDRVRVTYTAEGDLTGKGGSILSGRRREVARVYRIEVENFHARPVEMTVYDRLPVPKNEEIRVRPARDNTPPTRVDDEGHSGVMAWQQSVAPRGKQAIRFGYEVSFPAERTVPGF